MTFPNGFDPLSVTEVSLNECYFKGNDWEIAEGFVTDIFPNAKVKFYLFHEDLSKGVLKIEPEPPGTEEEITEFYDALEYTLPDGPHSRWPKPNIIDCPRYETDWADDSPEVRDPPVALETNSGELRPPGTESPRNED